MTSILENRTVSLDIGIMMFKGGKEGKEGRASPGRYDRWVERQQANPRVADSIPESGHVCLGGGPDPRSAACELLRCQGSEKSGNLC